MELIIKNLNKTYPNGVQALKDINLTIGSGMFGMLGPNGAGKSTLMRILATLQNPDSGSITFGNIDVINDKMTVRKILGYLPQDFGFYPKLSAKHLLHHFAILKGVTNKAKRIEVVSSLLQMTNLYEARNRNVSDFSGGMLQRFGIAQALLGNPKLIIVDEPTAGLDPNERNRFHNLLSEIAEDTVVLLSTHIVEDVKNLCKQMVVLNEGAIHFQGSPEEARRSIHGKIWEKMINKEDWGFYNSNFEIIVYKNIDRKRKIKVFSETRPDESFELSMTGMEDLYFTILNNPRLV